MPANENAAHWGQPGDGDEHKTVQTTNSYHGFPYLATGNQEFSEADSAEATLQMQLAQMRSLICEVVHDGIRVGRVEEAQRRCALLTAELEETRHVLALTAQQLEAELL